MELSNQGKYYDKLWSEQLVLNSLQLRRAIKVLEYFTRAKRKNHAPRVLDLGCGDGRFTAFLGEFAKTDGVELSQETVKNANKKYPHVNFIHGSALNVELESNTYDVVVSQEVIEHIEDQHQYIQVCERVLKKGGYLIMTTPNKKVFNHMEGGNWSKQPIEIILTPKEFKQLVSNKFKIVNYSSVIMNFGNLGYFKWINNKWVIGGCKKLGLTPVREAMLSKLGFGLHQCILAKKV